MEYFIEFMAWLRTVNIDLGMGIKINLFLLVIFPLACQFLKILLGVVVDRIDSGIGRSNSPSPDFYLSQSDVDEIWGKGSMSNKQISNKSYYIPDSFGND